ncbi:MAG: VTT domain-containing protein [Dehalococcoidales bacterium]|nr:MAG: VTT domain-containing protein [Dehalococcoidales bacterium]
MEEEVKRHWSKKELGLGALAIVATAGLCVAAVLYKDELTNTDYLARFGLLGVLIVSFIAGSTFSVTAIPVPYWLLVFTLPGLIVDDYGVLSPVWVGLLAGLGATVGQFITFMIGYGGRTFSEKITSKFSSRFYDRGIRFAERHGSLAVFLMSFIPNPIHLPMTIAIAALRYPPYKFLLFSFLGTGLKSLVIAFCGYFGFNSLFSWIGV